MYELFYIKRGEISETQGKFERFRQAFQFINGGSSNGYTRYFVELVHKRERNICIYSNLQYPSVEIRLSLNLSALIVDLDAEKEYNRLVEAQNRAREAGKLCL